MINYFYFFMGVFSGLLVSASLSRLILGYRPLTLKQVEALTEAAYYSALHPSWPQVFALETSQSYAIPPDDAERFGLAHGDDVPLVKLAEILEQLNEEDAENA